jgi:hypothetical protein
MKIIGFGKSMDDPLLYGGQRCQALQLLLNL